MPTNRKPGGSSATRPSDAPGSDLAAYRRKRDFRRTPEPAPQPASPHPGPLPGGEGTVPGTDLTFVVQKHGARRLHYDFRLELDGVLKSWAVPKGPSCDPHEKRLAVQVEDHPLPYGGFEGLIPHGQYGAGPVIVWDRGIYSPDEGGRLSFGDRSEAQQRLRAELQAGKLSIQLRGHRLRGSWTLVRTGDSRNWLLMKHRDQEADPQREVTAEETSVLSGRTLKDIESGVVGARIPEAMPAQPPAVGAAPRGRPRPSHPHDDIPGDPAPFPRPFRPMLASPCEAPFSHPDWLFELKLDGERALAFLSGDKTTLRARSGANLTSLYPAVVADLQAQEGEMVLDGEIVALDERGVPSFERLQRRLHLTAEQQILQADRDLPVFYYVFDLLHLEGRSLWRMPLEQRRALLQQRLRSRPHVAILDSVQGEGEAFYQGVVSLRAEGMVAKLGSSGYTPGQRSRDWLKIKATQAEDFLVCGYTEGSGRRAGTLGSLVLGIHEGERLRYAGNAGSGLDEGELTALRTQLDTLATSQSPFTEAPKLPSRARVHWAQPRLVARVRYQQWTSAGVLRAPVVIALRGDVTPGDIQLRPTLAPPAPARRALSDVVQGLLAQFEPSRDQIALEIEGHRLKLTNLTKTYWPATRQHRAYTKGDMVRYYLSVAPALLPHLRNRPITLTRYPGGIDGPSFYQKHPGQRLPAFVRTVTVFSSHREGDQPLIMVDNLATLVWLAQMGNLEVHAALSRVAADPTGTGSRVGSFTGSDEAVDASILNCPDFIVFDLDPYLYAGSEQPGEEPALNRQAFALTREVACTLHDILEQLGLSAFVKTTGKTGLHIYVPIQRRYPFAVVRKACEIIGRHLMQQRPDDLTLAWATDKRTGKVFFDHNQNSRGKTLAAAYSLRPSRDATVSLPVTWRELPQLYPTDFTVETVPARLATTGDIWANIQSHAHDLSALLER